MPLIYAAQLSYQHLPPLRTIDKYFVQLDPYGATHIVYRVPSQLHRESHHVRWTFETTSSQFTSMSWVSFGMFPSSVWRQMSRSGSSGWVLAPSRKCRTSDKDLIQICSKFEDHSSALQLRAEFFSRAPTDQGGYSFWGINMNTPP